jgi:hypothetical protein
MHASLFLSSGADAASALDLHLSSGGVPGSKGDLYGDEWWQPRLLHCRQALYSKPTGFARQLPPHNLLGEKRPLQRTKLLTCCTGSVRTWGLDRGW